MKFKFKEQSFQKNAVKNTINVFKGQPYNDGNLYKRNLGENYQITTDDAENYNIGYCNHAIELDDHTILKNINAVQNACGISASKELSRGDGKVNLDIEMETGTGKTYVYINTMFELHKQYGWSKFIVVVPSVAIREGVAKSFRMLEDHFYELYGKKARWFIYNSNNLRQLDVFSQNRDVSVMIINTQTFNTLKENNKESRIIYSERDDFGSRRPIDIIAANRPIIIEDEPQRLEGKATIEGIKRFKPLFVLYYSATHKTPHNTIYSLDAVDAFQLKLVKRISVNGVKQENLKGTSGYLYLEKIIVSKDAAPVARIEIETQNKSGNIVRKSYNLSIGENLRKRSNLAVYDGYVISDINAAEGKVSFTNGVVLSVEEKKGAENDNILQEERIKQTIKTHLEKERGLFERGIKCLSLFFIDKVEKYRVSDDNGKEIKGEYQTIFEREYDALVKEELKKYDSDNISEQDKKYKEYLSKYTALDVHKGYFSIDKKNCFINSKGDSKEDISTYDLILNAKERLLSFDEPTRFIFSHSALREGWDNPNVFQICTLRQSKSTTTKRQEVGRGLRLCVNKDGVRMDSEELGEDVVQQINELTIIPNESFETFADTLQTETIDSLRERVEKATTEYFKGKKVKEGDGLHEITDKEASRIIVYLEDNGYVDDDNNITPLYKESRATGNVKPLPEKLQPISEGIFQLINAIFDKSVLNDMVGDDNKRIFNKANKNYSKKEFLALWDEINHQYVYTVNYKSEELIENAVKAINENLNVTKLNYVVIKGTQSGNDGLSFEETSTERGELKNISTSNVKYDLVGDIAKGASLTRKTIVEILTKIKEEKLNYFKTNPEEFIHNVTQIIKEQKATMIVEDIQYKMTEGKFTSEIFTIGERIDKNKAHQVKKHITDYIVGDSSVETKFADELDKGIEVVVYAKLKRSFKIPTPVGDYAPDWAIAMKKDDVKHVFFIAETKGTLESMQLRKVEAAKIKCAEKLFNECSTAKVKYKHATSYKDLMNALCS